MSTSTIIRNGRVVEDTWIHLEDEPLAGPSRQPISVSWARWDADGPTLLELARAGRSIGLRIPTELGPEALLEVLPHLSLIAFEIPKFVDGRFYSTARLLRMRHGYAGELRARGDVLPDQLAYMRRCGIDTFELKPGKSVDTALRVLSGFSVAYQGAEDVGPLFRRRTAP